MDHTEVKLLVPAYALGAVPEAEIGAIRDHIMSCDDCMAEADSFATAAGSLAFAVDPVPLPSGFEDQVVRLATHRVEVERVQAGSLRGRWSFAPMVAVIGAGLAVVILAVALFDARSTVSRDQRVIAALLHENGLALSGEGGVGRAIPRADGSLFVATGLQDAPVNHTYQLWFMRGPDCPTSEDCEIVSGGTFDVEDGIAILEVDESISSWDASAVSVEPEGGSQDPTLDSVIMSSFATSG